MTRSSPIAKLDFDPEIERTFHILRRTAKHITTEEASPSRYTESPPGFNAVVELSRENKPEPVVENMANTANKSLKEDRKSTRLNSSHSGESRMPSSA